ncbi:MULTISPECIES: FTR1 family protein [Corynebacterium]|uniref:FTR1 family iron permease n=1 Tax=Corynebacterium TaxID=1716 RepID=UPI00178C81EC|nr:MULTISPECIES: FTR1 family protein [Corynebacterium]
MFLANFLFSLREGVEAAVIVGMLIALVTRAGRRDLLPRLWLGVALAAGLSLLLGAVAAWGPYAASARAHLLLSGVLSVASAGVVTWLIFLLATHSRGHKRRHDPPATLTPASTKWVLVLAIISVARLGTDTALVVCSALKAVQTDGVVVPAAGSVAGLIASAVIGWLVYTGIGWMNFSVCIRFMAALFLLTAAGSVSHGLGDLQAASLLPGWGSQLYDVSGYFDNGNFLLRTDTLWFVLGESMFKLNLSPTHLQVAGWVLYLFTVLPLYLRASSPRQSSPSAERCQQS